MFDAGYTDYWTIYQHVKRLESLLNYHPKVRPENVKRNRMFIKTMMIVNRTL